MDKILKTFIQFVVIINFLGFSGIAQNSEKISTIEFIKIVNENEKEALFYYSNNWKKNMTKAQNKNYIDSYQLIKFRANLEEPLHLILVTTYLNLMQWNSRIKNFEKLEQLTKHETFLNEKPLNEFREILYTEESINF